MSRVTVTGRGGGRPPKLSREAILGAARSLPPHEVTLAAVGAQLGVTSPALYRYFPDRTAILEALAAEAREQLVPPPADLPWEEWLRAAARMERDLWRVHSDLYTSADYRASATPLAQIMIVGLEVMIRAGFAADDALVGLTIVSELAHAVGHAETRQKQPPPYPEELADRLRALLGDAMPKGLEQVLEQSLDITIEGLRSRLAR
jgi:AcrR family transcriptional regulator